MRVWVVAGLTVAVSAAALRARWIVAAYGSTAQWTGKRDKDAKKDPPREAVKDVSMPFQVGEKLNYRVAWATFSSAATVETSVVEQRDLFGWKTWHLKALIHTAGSVRSLFTIDDQADSYVDAQTQQTRQFELYLDELGRKQNQVLRPVARGDTARGGPGVIVQAGTRDPLGALYTLRAVDWRATPEVTVPVYDGRNLFEMRAKVEGASEKVTTAAGKFDAMRVGVKLFQFGKEGAENSFVIWFAQDRARTPVAIEAALPFGSLHAEMVPTGK